MTTKFCINCMYCKYNENGRYVRELYFCTRPNIENVHLVTGIPSDFNTSCETERYPHKTYGTLDVCGPEGKYYFPV